MGDDGSKGKNGEPVEVLQGLLVSLHGLNEQTKTCTNVLMENLDSKTLTVKYLEQVLGKTDKPLQDLIRMDREFRELSSRSLMDSAAASQAFKVKKLKTDYERKLHVGETISRAQNGIKRGRYILANLKRKERELVGRSNPFSDNERNKQPRHADHQLQQEQFQVVREYDERRNQVEETEELRNIARNCLLVEEMATEVGSLLEVQQDDINRLEQNTDESISKAMEGVHELSMYKKKQASSGATKASLGSATVGGLVGILGGPVGIALGAAAGGVVGMVAGKGVAAVKKRSINAETRRIKALLSVKETKRGEYYLSVQAYEYQQWSYLQRCWQHLPNKWRDEFGEETIGANPENDMSAPEARLQVLATARSSDNLSPEDLEEIVKVHEREVQLNIQWKWTTGKWHQSMDRPNTDLAGWDYGKSINTDTWLPEAGRGCTYRRRLWVRALSGKPGNMSSSSSRAQQGGGSQEQLLRVNDVRLALQDESSGQKVLWDGIYQSTVNTNTVMNESLKRTMAQGDQIGNAERNATVVGDISVYSERIHRASNLSGALKNMMSWPTGTKLSETEQFAKEVQKRREMAEQEFDAKYTSFDPPKKNEQDEIIEQTSRTLSENLKIANRMHGELETQNVQLDRTASAVERGNEGLLKITKRIK